MNDLLEKKRRDIDDKLIQLTAKSQRGGSLTIERFRSSGFATGLSAVMVWNNSWGDLAAGRNLRGVGVWTPTKEGIQNFRRVLDVNKQITESDENNQKELLFKVVK